MSMSVEEEKRLLDAIKTLCDRTAMRTAFLMLFVFVVGTLIVDYVWWRWIE